MPPCCRITQEQEEPKVGVFVEMQIIVSRSQLILPLCPNLISDYKQLFQVFALWSLIIIHSLFNVVMFALFLGSEPVQPVLIKAKHPSNV
jgi:hypothetical protein